MKKIFFVLWLVAFSLVLSYAVAVRAADDDFTANGDITIELTNGSIAILNNSTAESLIITDGVLTVTNPGSTSTPLFKLRPIGNIVSIRAYKDGADVGCSDTTLTLPTTAGHYLISERTTACSGSVGGGGAGGGSTTVTPPITPTPTTTTPTVTQVSPASIGALGSAVKTIMTTVDTLTKFTTPLSKEVELNHSIKISSLDKINKTIKVILQSDPVTVELALGETKKVDLDKDGVDDINVKFNNLIGDNINLSLSNIVILEKSGLHVGDLIKTAKDSAVYYIGSSGKKHLFVNSVTFWTWHSGSWSNITYKGAKKTLKVISQADFDSLELGGHVTVNPGVKLIKFQNSPRVYVVTTGRILREVVKSSGDDAVAKALYGAKYKDQVVTIQNGFENDYTRGEVLTTTSPKPTETEGIDDLTNK